MITDRLISWLMSVLFPTFGAPRKAIFKDFWASWCIDVSLDCRVHSCDSFAEMLTLFERHRRKYHALARIVYFSIVSSISSLRDRNNFEEFRGNYTHQVDLRNYASFLIFLLSPITNHYCHCIKTCYYFIGYCLITWAHCILPYCKIAI